MTTRPWSHSTAALKEKLALALALAQARPPWPRPWISPSAWTSGETVWAGEVRKNSAVPAQWYVAVSNGVCGATEPTLTTGVAASDGTVLWIHLGGPPSLDTATDPDAPVLTLTGSTSTPAGLTAISTLPNQNMFGFMGCVPIDNGSGNRCVLKVFERAAGDVVRGGYAAFWSDAPLLGFEAPNSSTGLSIWVDGRPVTPSPIYANSGAAYWFTVNCGSRKPRLWEVHGSKDAAYLYRLAISSLDQVWPYKPAVNVRGAFIGDSYLGGSSYGPWLYGNTLTAAFGRLAGIADMWRFGIGGTGLLNPGSGPYYTYRQRLPQVLATNPDVIFVYGSTNDAAYTQATLTTEALAFLDAIREETDAPVFWFGPASVSVSNLGIIDTAIGTAVAARPNSNIFYKSMVTATPPWITGSHNNASYSWTSNISQYIGGDNLHPVDKGTMYLAQRMAATYSAEMLPLVA